MKLRVNTILTEWMMRVAYNSTPVFLHYFCIIIYESLDKYDEISRILLNWLSVYRIYDAKNVIHIPFELKIKIKSSPSPLNTISYTITISRNPKSSPSPLNTISYTNENCIINLSQLIFI